MTDAIKLKVLPQFPARLIGRAGIDVTKTTGDYYLDLDFNDFPVVGAVPAGTTYALIFNPATGQYVQIPISLLGSGSLAPATALPLVESGAGAVGVSVKYAREDHVHPALGGGGGASVLVSDTPPVGAADNSLWWESDSGITYIRYNDGNTTQWVAVSAGGGGLTDAPADGSAYGRKNNAWSKAVDLAGDTMTGALVIPTPAVNDNTGKATNMAAFGAWQAYTPTVAAVTGTLGATTVIARYRQINKVVFFTLSISISSAGTSPGVGVKSTLPVTPATYDFTFAGRDMGATGSLLVGFMTLANGLVLQKYDATFIGGTGSILVVSGSYEAA
jgi:hypothetical protein